MAPTKKRSSIRAKAAARTSSSSTSKPITTFSDLGAAFAEDIDSSATAVTSQPTKRAKREAKSTSFLSHLTSSGRTNSSGITKKVKRSRGKEAKTRGKLVTSLTNLADALPDFGIDDGNTREGGVKAGNKMIGIPGLNDINISFARTRAGNIATTGVPKKMKSLGTKRGMGKRKEKLETAERQRFQQNVAVIMGDEKFGIGKKLDDSGKSEGSGQSAAGGLQALRAFIHHNMAVQKAL